MNKAINFAMKVRAASEARVEFHCKDQLNNEK
jgi:hypothetical protein